MLILEIRDISPKKCDCGNVALYELTLGNKDLPKYSQDGSRYITEGTLVLRLTRA